MDSTQLNQLWDVIVAGGGPGGVNAAVAAARRGASVLLIEQHGYLGGMATAGLVNPFMPYVVKATGQRLTTGIFNEILDRLEKRGGLARDRATFDDEQMKLVLDDLTAESGVSVLLHAFVSGVEISDGTIQSVKVCGKSPESDRPAEFQLRAKLFIDSTGDGDLAALAGCECELGRPADGLCQPMTLCFRLAGVQVRGDFSDWEHPLRQEVNRVYQEAKVRGEISNPREDVLIFATLHPDVLHFNTTRVIRHSGVDVVSLSEAEQIARRQVVELLALLKERVPAFKNAYLQKMAAHIGVRESRRVLGQHVLTVEEVLSGQKFPDGVARSNYEVDIHNPAGTGTEHHSLPEGEYYEIPYGCLVPRGVNNLLIGSRCISATHEAHSSMRIMPVVAGIGEATGIAAAMCLKRDSLPANLDGRLVRQEIGME